MNRQDETLPGLIHRATRLVSVRAVRKLTGALNALGSPDLRETVAELGDGEAREGWITETWMQGLRTIHSHTNMHV